MDIIDYVSIVYNIHALTGLVALLLKESDIARSILAGGDILKKQNRLPREYVWRVWFNVC